MNPPLYVIITMLSLAACAEIYPPAKPSITPQYQQEPYYDRMRRREFNNCFIDEKTKDLNIEVIKELNEMEASESLIAGMVEMILGIGKDQKQLAVRNDDLLELEPEDYKSRAYQVCHDRFYGH